MFKEHHLLKMTDSECLELSALVEKNWGIKLGISKKSMMQSRLDRRLQHLHIPNYQDYVSYLSEHQGELQVLINALSTNKTEFWREKNHFNILPSLLANTSGTKYFWSAASSAGQEVYTLGIVAEEIRQKNCHFDYRILGTDIDTKVLVKAQQGSYPRSELTNFSPGQLEKFFLRGTGRNEGYYRATTLLQEKIKFRQHNLVDIHSSFPLKFDIIFLRNVLIYFSRETIQQVIDKMDRHLSSGGYLFLGHSETLNGIRHHFRSLQGSVYQKMK